MRATPSGPQIALPATVAALGMLLVSGITGCVAPAQSSSMVVRQAEARRHFAGSVTIEVSGGRETDENLRSEISSAAFREALMESLRNAQLFRDVQPGAHGDYQLAVRLVQSKGSGTLTIRMKQVARWALRRGSEDVLLLDEFVTGEGKAAIGDALAAVKRYQVALERAGQDNIRAGLARIAALDLPDLDSPDASAQDQP